jgi:hypothetical protein
MYNSSSEMSGYTYTRNYGKPVAVTFSLPIKTGVIIEAASRLTRETGTTCYTSFTQAVRAYSALNRYAGYRRKIAHHS